MWGRIFARAPLFFFTYHDFPDFPGNPDFLKTIYIPCKPSSSSPLKDFVVTRMYVKNASTVCLVAFFLLLLLKHHFTASFGFHDIIFLSKWFFAFCFFLLVLVLLRICVACTRHFPGRRKCIPSKALSGRERMHF